MLRILGLDSYFEGIVYGDFSNKETYYCKPQPESFVTVSSRYQRIPLIVMLKKTSGIGEGKCT